MDEQPGVTNTVDPKLEKIKKFGENPDKFICMDDLVVAIVKTDGGMATWLGECSRVDMEVAQSRLNYKIGEAFRYMDMQMAAKRAEEKKGGIITEVGTHNGAPLFGRKK